MKLERRFNWADRVSIYKEVDEDEVEKATEGRVRFTCVRVSDGRIFAGVSFPSTVAQMCDTTTGYWKLQVNPKKPEKSIVVEATIPLAQSPSGSEATLKESLKISTRKGREG